MTGPPWTTPRTVAWNGADLVYTAHAVLTGPSSSPVTGELLTDLLWLHAHPRHEVDHIRTRTRPGRIDVIVFTGNPDVDVLADLIRRTIAASPPLAEWFLH